MNKCLAFNNKCPLTASALLCFYRLYHLYACMHPLQRAQPAELTCVASWGGINTFKCGGAGQQ